MCHFSRVCYITVWAEKFFSFIFQTGKKRLNASMVESERQHTHTHTSNTEMANREKGNWLPVHDCSIYLKNVFQSFSVHHVFGVRILLESSHMKTDLFNFSFCELQRRVFYHFPHTHVCWGCVTYWPSLWLFAKAQETSHNIFSINSYRVRPLFIS